MRTSSGIVIAALGGIVLPVIAMVTMASCSDTSATADATDAGPDASDASDANKESEAAPPPVSTMATLTSVIARAVGRSGADLQVTVQGEDPTQTAYAAHIRVRDAQGAKIVAFDGNWSGPGPGVFGDKAAERRVLFDPSDTPGQTSFTRTVTLPGILAAFPAIARIDFAVLTAGDKHSIKHFADVNPQPTVSKGKTCDPALLTDRCAAGFGCIGTPPTCATAGAPALALLAYVPGPDGPHMLFQGSDPTGELGAFHVEFLDSVGGPQMIDLGNANFAVSQELGFGGTWSSGAFFFDNVAPSGFEGTVSRIAATPLGAGTNKGPRTVAAFGKPPLKPAGQACDVRGFVGCATGNACERDPATGTDLCVPRATAKTRLTSAAPILDPSTGPSLATGYTRGASLWDPPAACLAASAKGRPEGVVRLHLAADVASLTISTAVEVTNFDTVLYLLPGAGDTEDSAIDCNDDSAGSASTITLQDLPAGDYTIIVDSKSMVGGQFGVSLQ
jgi:hypothetical protein